MVVVRENANIKARGVGHAKYVRLARRPPRREAPQRLGPVQLWQRLERVDRDQHRPRESVDAIAALVAPESTMACISARIAWALV